MKTTLNIVKLAKIKKFNNILPLLLIQRELLHLVITEQKRDRNTTQGPSPTACLHFCLLCTSTYSHATLSINLQYGVSNLNFTPNATLNFFAFWQTLSIINFMSFKFWIQCFTTYPHKDYTCTTVQLAIPKTCCAVSSPLRTTVNLQ